MKPFFTIVVLFLLGMIFLSSSCGEEVRPNTTIYNDCYYLKSEIARKLFKENRPQDAFDFFESAKRESGKLLREDCILMAGCCLQLGKEIDGQQYLQQAVAQGYRLDKVRKKDYLQPFLPIVDKSNLAKTEAQYTAGIHLAYTHFIDSLLEIDGKLRRESRADVSWEELAISDSLNAMAFLDWLNHDLNNLPAQHLLENEAKLQTYALILHASYYAPLNKQFVEIADHIIKLGYVEPYLYDYLVQRSEKAMGKQVVCRISTRTISEEDMEVFDRVGAKGYLLEVGACRF